MPGIHPAEPPLAKNIPKQLGPKLTSLKRKSFNLPIYLTDAESTKPVRNNPSKVIPVWSEMKTARCLYLSESQAKNITLAA
jgi:hypothetical protein